MGSNLLIISRCKIISRCMMSVVVPSLTSAGMFMSQSMSIDEGGLYMCTRTVYLYHFNGHMWFGYLKVNV